MDRWIENRHLRRYWRSDDSCLSTLKKKENLFSLARMSDRYENLVKIRSLVARIELRINPKEHRDFVDSLQALKRATDEKSNFHDEVDALTIESQKLLKKEWNVVKSGELTFRATKVAAAALVCAALLAGAGTIFFDLLRNQQGPTPAASTKSAP